MSKIFDLKKLSDDKTFLIVADCKLYDTAKYEYGDGLFKYYEWADIITIFINKYTDNTLNDIRNVLSNKELLGKRGVLLYVDDISNKELAKELANKNKDLIIGFICDKIIDENYLNIKIIDEYKDNMELDTNILLVGNSIFNSKNPKESTTYFKGWPTLSKKYKQQNQSLTQSMIKEI